MAASRARVTGGAVPDSPPSSPATDRVVCLDPGDRDALIAYVRLLLEWDARRSMKAPTATEGETHDSPEDRRRVRAGSHDGSGS